MSLVETSMAYFFPAGKNGVNIEEKMYTWLQSSHLSALLVNRLLTCFEFGGFNCLTMRKVYHAMRCRMLGLREK